MGVLATLHTLLWGMSVQRRHLKYLWVYTQFRKAVSNTTIDRGAGTTACG